jgi:hypothetical protein
MVHVCRQHEWGRAAPHAAPAHLQIQVRVFAQLEVLVARRELADPGNDGALPVGRGGTRERALRDAQDTPAPDLGRHQSGLRKVSSIS